MFFHKDAGLIVLILGFVAMLVLAANSKTLEQSDININNIHTIHDVFPKS